MIVAGSQEGRGEVGTQRPVRHDRLGSWSVRLSAEYDVTTEDGAPDGYVRIRLDQTAEDLLAGYNRPEHLRAFPETDPLFIDVQRPLRASAESANR
ncbi:MAG TPA: hypothetical protein VMO52_07850 [Acidimicrobiia bacterium]|nr:hypothetical protein [Acidimicrobiia bacterium]